MLLALGISVGILLQPGGIHLYSWLYDHFLQLASASLVMSAFQATWVYAYSYYSGELLALGGNSGIFIYDVSSAVRLDALVVDTDFVPSGSWVDHSTRPSLDFPRSTSRHSTRSGRELSAGHCSTLPVRVSNTSDSARSPIACGWLSCLKCGTLSTVCGRR